MKIRKGFVSNSSSSSFIVQTKECFLDKGEFLASQKDVEKIKDFGFEETTISNPHHYKIKEITEDDKDFLNYMGYYVSCNQHEVLYFLIKNNIPFKASCHYDQQYYEYQKDSDFVLYCHNYGQEIAMYGYKDFGNFINYYPKKPIEKISKQEFIKIGEKQYED